MKPAAPEVVDLGLQAILPFHLGSRRSSKVLGASALETMLVL